MIGFLLMLLATVPGEVSPLALETAEHALNHVYQDTENTLADLVRFKTVNEQGKDVTTLPEFRAMAAYLKNKAESLGLDFADHGAVLVIGLGQSSQRLGIVTHGDVQPADATYWKADPFTLDTSSEAGRLVARGTEDDKGPIATALHAMAVIAARKLPLKRRIELIISLTEESDWKPFREFLEKVPPPQLNVAIDAEYPVVVAEKGWCGIELVVGGTDAQTGARITAFTGGAFMSQVPGIAKAVVADATPQLEESLKNAADNHQGMHYTFNIKDQNLHIEARGKSAHSSTPQDGVNAISHLADLLKDINWKSTRAGRTVRLINDLVGTGYRAEKFGTIAYSHDFMGPLTLSVSLVKDDGGKLTTGINLRAPKGKEPAQLEKELRDTLSKWATDNAAELELTSVYVSGGFMREDVVHVDVLLDVFEHYTGIKDAKPISIGGGTHARLVPQGVNFGPAMPGHEYTGHSEHEFITRDQFQLNLKMYTAMMVMLAADQP